MKINNDNIKSIAVNIISNMIFQIILVCVSGSGIIYTIRHMIKSLSNNNITISILNLFILILSCIIITGSLFLLCRSIRIRKQKDNFSFDDIKDYYFSDYEKHITIYQNGNGIIMHKFKIIVNDKSKLQKIRRKLNIEDGCKTSRFPSLEKMMKTNKADRFHEFGFWYKSDDNIINNVKEYYWDSKNKNENKKLKSNPQEIRWIFKIDSDKVEEKKPYEICYVISIPGIAALQNGKLNRELLYEPSEENSYSCMRIDHKIQKLKCIISFEDGVCLDSQPKCKCIISEQDSEKEVDIEGTYEYNLLYKKYIFSINNPIFGSDINISWKYDII